MNEIGKLPEATAALEETVKLDPQFAQAWYNLGLAYEGLGKSANAVRHYQHYLQAKPDAPNRADRSRGWNLTAATWVFSSRC